MLKKIRILELRSPLQTWRLILCNPIQYQWQILICVQRWEWRSRLSEHRMADEHAAWKKLWEPFRPELFLPSYYSNPSLLDVVYFSFMLKSIPEKAAIKLQESLSALMVTRHQLPGVAVGLRSVTVVCNRTESIFWNSWLRSLQETLDSMWHDGVFWDFIAWSEFSGGWENSASWT